jgi:two-component system chemotaxis sensor kinase CheA
MSLDPSRYAELFRTESREQLAAITSALLQLEEGGDTGEQVTVIFRAVHTVKGMSATMGYRAVAEYAHEIETLLDQMRRGVQTLTPDLADALFACTDALESGLDSASETAEQTEAMVAALQRLREVPIRSATSEMIGDVVAGGGGSGEVVTADPMVGPGVIVRVRQSNGVELPGVRAYLIIEKARALGEVAGISPPLAELQAAESAQSFAMRVVTSATPEEIERAVRSAGDIDRVEVDVAGRRRSRTPRTQRVNEEERAPEGVARTVVRGPRHVRMDLARLDALMNLIGELVITRGRLLQLTAGHGDGALDDEMQRAARLISDLQTEILTSRLVPVWQLFDRFPRLVRDAARQSNKDVSFVVEGKDIELDRSLLDEIGEPVVHLLRNAIDHGIESPSDRVAAGKSRGGRLVLSAVRDRAAVLVRVSDDGRGVDRPRVLARAKALGLVDEATEELDDEQLFRCIARAGFSTAEKVSELSGRGVGIDAVQAKARALGGSVQMKSVMGEGTTITIRLPLTLAIVRAILARTGNERYALPLTHVRETLEFGEHTVRHVKGKEVLLLRDEVLPLLHLRDVVGQDGAHAPGGEIVVIERGDRRSGLVVDELIGQEEVVVKQFDAARDGLLLFSGATILADGLPALIMDVGSLFEGA